jgi:signal transduction histidine kinase
MQINKLIKELLGEISWLTGSDWVVIASMDGSQLSLENMSLSSKKADRLLKLINSHTYFQKIIASFRKNRFVQFSLEKGDGLGVRRFFVVPISENAGILVGTDFLDAKTKKTWKVASVIVDNLVLEDDQSPKLQEALQELDNLQQELQARVSAQQAAEARLIQTTKLAAVGEMAAGVAHELNNPLTTVVGFSELVLESLPLDSPQRADMVVVLKEARRARDVVRRLLDFSRQSETLRMKADLNELIRDVLSLMQHMFHINGVSISTVFDEKLPWVFIDRNQMKQVFLNLFHNALNAMPEGGELSIETRQTTRYGSPFASVDIKDNGTGISSENLPRIFEPFFTTRAGQGGTGLGLSVTYGIISEHDGAIEVVSIPGKGSTFTVFIPLKEK